MALASCSGANHATPGTISIQPPSANVPVGQTQSFQTYSGGTVVTAPISWQVNGMTGGNSALGTISAFGLYTAPGAIPSPPNVTITAALQADPSQMATATATVGPFVSVSPTLAIVETYGTQQFSVLVTGISNTAVSWQVGCPAGGSTCGAISQTGLYKAPNAVPTAGGVMVVATSQAAPAFSGSVAVGISSLNQQPQPMPILLGTSGSNANSTCIQGNVESCSAGTMGALLTRAGTQYILSNSHVLAFTSADGAVGDPIVQPGLLDTSPQTCDLAKVTTVGNLSQFTHPQTDTGTTVDAAIAQVVNSAVDTSGLIEELGATVVNGIPQPGAPAQGSGIAASLNQLVAKSGRSTGLTCASVEAVSVSSKVQYPSPCSTVTSTVNYSNQVAIGGAGFSAGGDSGSLIVDASTAQPVALLFADDSTTSLGNPVSDVLNALKDTSGNLPTFVGGAAHSVAACSLPPPVSNVAASPAPNVSAERIHAAAEIENRHAAELLANPAVLNVDVGPSLDAPGEAAVLIFIQKGAKHNLIPEELDGVRTRVVEREEISSRGSLSPEPSAQLSDQAGQGNVAALSREAVQLAIRVKGKYAAELMSDAAVRGVGVSASLDSPGDVALILYILKGKTPHIPVTIQGLRTRVKETLGFYAGNASIGTSSTCSSPFKRKRLGNIPR
jgi:hypothetical protein